MCESGSLPLAEGGKGAAVRSERTGPYRPSSTKAAARTPAAGASLAAAPPGVAAGAHVLRGGAVRAIARARRQRGFSPAAGASLAAGIAASAGRGSVAVIVGRAPVVGPGYCMKTMVQPVRLEERVPFPRVSCARNRAPESPRPLVGDVILAYRRHQTMSARFAHLIARARQRAHLLGPVGYRTAHGFQNYGARDQSTIK